MRSRYHPKLAACQKTRLPVVLFVAALALTLLPAEAEVSYWGQAATQLDVFRGAPLLSANWEGRYRPYLFRRGRYVPLARNLPEEYSSWDFYRPLTLSGTEVLLSGSDSGRPHFDIFRYDDETGVLANLTASPDVDEGNLCVDRESRTLAYRRGRNEQFARLREGLSAIRHRRLPAFARCIFTGPGAALGFVRTRPGYLLYRCTISGESVSCRRHPALDRMEEVSRFFRSPGGGIGIIGRSKGDVFRRPFLLAPSYNRLEAIRLPEAVEGDVLDFDGSTFRVGFESRYWASVAPDFEGIVYSVEKIGTDHFGVVATSTRARTVARAVDGAWRLFPHPGTKVPDPVPIPREVWLKSPSGERFQAFHFGAGDGTKVVLWWHGGPHENVSPRFNPYFAKLAEMGFSVYAVNYPGSTGRGAEYEKRFDEKHLGECLRAVWRHLADRGARIVVSWSVSAGVRIQSLVLRNELPVSGIVDQAGIGRTSLFEAAAANETPLFVIRGRYDSSGPIARVDYRYSGGHDIVTQAEFEGLFERISGFLARVQPIGQQPTQDPPRGDSAEASSVNEDRRIPRESRGAPAGTAGGREP